MASGPLIRITPTAPVPDGVAIPRMVSESAAAPRNHAFFGSCALFSIWLVVRSMYFCCAICSTLDNVQ